MPHVYYISLPRTEAAVIVIADDTRHQHVKRNRIQLLCDPAIRWCSKYREREHMGMSTSKMDLDLHFAPEGTNGVAVSNGSVTVLIFL